MKDLTVRELSELLHCSLPTVRKKIDELSIEPVGKRGKGLVYDIDKCEKLFSLFGISFEEIEKTIEDGSRTAKEKEKKNIEKEIENKRKEKKTENNENRNSEGLEDNELKNFLFEEMKRKEKEIEFFKQQIEQKDELIKNLTNKNDALLSAILQLEVKAEEVEGAAAASEQEEVKEGFFKRLGKWFKG